jgi:hypothetical protein
MPTVTMSGNEWREITGAIEVADGEGMILHAQQLIDKIKRQLDEQED